MPRSKSEEEMVSLNLSITPSFRRKLERMLHESDASSITEVIRNAARVYDYLLSERRKGQKIITQGHDGEREVIIL